MAVQYDPNARKASRRLPVVRVERTSRLGPALAVGGLLLIGGALTWSFLREPPAEPIEQAAPAPVVSKVEPQPADEPTPEPRARSSSQPYTVPSAPRSSGSRPARPPKAEDFTPKADGPVLASAPAGSRSIAPAEASTPRATAPATMKPGRVELTPEQEGQARERMKAFEAQYRKRKLAEAVRKAEEALKVPPAGDIRSKAHSEHGHAVELDGSPGDLPALTAEQTAQVEADLAEIKAQQARSEALSAPVAKVLAQHGWEGLRRAAVRQIASQGQKGGDAH